MKLTSIIFLGLSMTVAVASGDVNLRGNALSRHLGAGSSGDEADGENVEEAEGDPDDENSDENNSDDVDQENAEGDSDENYDSYLYGNITQGNFTSDESTDNYQVSDSNGNGNGGGSWMYYFMLNALNLPLDAVGQGGCCKTNPPTRCHFPHIGPGPHKDSHTGSCSSASSNGSGGSRSGGDSGTQEQYEQYIGNGRGGNAQQVHGSKGLNVWGFLIAALIAGVVSAALMASKKVSINLRYTFKFSCAYATECFTNFLMHSFKTIEA